MYCLEYYPEKVNNIFDKTVVFLVLLLFGNSEGKYIECIYSRNAEIIESSEITGICWFCLNPEQYMFFQAGNSAGCYKIFKFKDIQ